MLITSGQVSPLAYQYERMTQGPSRCWYVMRWMRTAFLAPRGLFSWCKTAWQQRYVMSQQCTKNQQPETTLFISSLPHTNITHNEPVTDNTITKERTNCVCANLVKCGAGSTFSNASAGPRRQVRNIMCTMVTCRNNANDLVKGHLNTYFYLVHEEVLISHLKILQYIYYTQAG